ncbi:unnamed protein product [Cochlearia groenlandica]
MKKLGRKGTVHPCTPSTTTKHDHDHFLSLLPFTILSLAAALSQEDREVLAYLISKPLSLHNKVKDHNNNNNNKHSPMFLCDCFSCYTSYWVRWDTSPNRRLIHEIIDAFEDNLEMKKKTKKKKKKKRSVRVNSVSQISELGSNELVSGDDSVEKGFVEKFLSFIGQKFSRVSG